jgi:hypothetical protein
MFLTSSPAGFVAMMNVKKDGSWVKMVQDTDTTAWASETINEPALDVAREQRVYYIEVTLQDATNRTPAVGEPRSVFTKDFTNVASKAYCIKLGALNLPTSL